MPKTITGSVSSASADKTIIVKVERRKTHPLYRKQYTETTKFMAHDEKNQAQVGDKVAIKECRPISRRKHFVLHKVLDQPKLREESLAVIKQDDVAIKSPKEKNS